MTLFQFVVMRLLAIGVRRVFDGGITDAEEIETQCGMTVYATIPMSPCQAGLVRTHGNRGVDGHAALRLDLFGVGDAAIEDAAHPNREQSHDDKLEERHVGQVYMCRLSQ